MLGIAVSTSLSDKINDKTKPKPIEKIIDSNDEPLTLDKSDKSYQIPKESYEVLLDKINALDKEIVNDYIKSETTINKSDKHMQILINQQGSSVINGILDNLVEKNQNVHTQPKSFRYNILEQKLIHIGLLPEFDPDVSIVKRKLRMFVRTLNYVLKNKSYTKLKNTIINHEVSSQGFKLKFLDIQQRIKKSSILYGDLIKTKINEQTSYLCYLKKQNSINFIKIVDNLDTRLRLFREYIQSVIIESNEFSGSNKKNLIVKLNEYLENIFKGLMPAYKPGVVYDSEFHNVFERLSSDNNKTRINNDRSYQSLKGKIQSKDLDITFSLLNSNEVQFDTTINTTIDLIKNNNSIDKCDISSMNNTMQSKSNGYRTNQGYNTIQNERINQRNSPVFINYINKNKDVDNRLTPTKLFDKQIQIDKAYNQTKNRFVNQRSKSETRLRNEKENILPDIRIKENFKQMNIERVKKFQGKKV